MVSECGRLFSGTRELTPSPLGNGYFRVNVKRQGKQHTLLVHRAVAEAFLPNPEGKATVNHRDGNKANNHLGNLEWSTYAENAKHAWDTGLVTAYRREAPHRERIALIAKTFPRNRRGWCIALPKQP